MTKTSNRCSSLINVSLFIYIIFLLTGKGEKEEGGERIYQFHPQNSHKNLDCVRPNLEARKFSLALCSALSLLWLMGTHVPGASSAASQAMPWQEAGSEPHNNQDSDTVHRHPTQCLYAMCKSDLVLTSGTICRQMFKAIIKNGNFENPSSVTLPLHTVEHSPPDSSPWVCHVVVTPPSGISLPLLAQHWLLPVTLEWFSPAIPGMASSNHSSSINL